MTSFAGPQPASVLWRSFPGSVKKLLGGSPEGFQGPPVASRKASTCWSLEMVLRELGGREGGTSRRQT